MLQALHEHGQDAADGEVANQGDQGAECWSGEDVFFDGADQAWLVLAGDWVIAGHDGLSDDPAGAEGACSWAAGVLADEGAGPVSWQRAGAGEYEARSAAS